MHTTVPNQISFKPDNAGVRTSGNNFVSSFNLVLGSSSLSIRSLKDLFINKILPGIVLSNILVALPAYAGPIGLPDTSRPGAVRPGQQDQTRAEENIPVAPVTDVVEIPEVVERPFDINEGDMIIVKEFRLLGIEDAPDSNINIDEIRLLLEKQRELHPDGFTIGQLQQVADVVTTYYRKQGLILANAVVPVQTVRDGRVDLLVFIGELSRVLVESNEIYDDKILEKPFLGLIGKPIKQKEIEAALLTLTDYPGLSIFGVFQPGLYVGTADIVLKVQEEDRFDFLYRADSHGTRETGRSRLTATVDWNNVMGFADRLTLSAQRSFNPKNNVFGLIDYERFLANGFKAGGFIDSNSFDVGGEFRDNNIATKTENRGVFLEKSLIRSRQKNLSVRFGLTLKSSRTRTSQIDTNRNRLSVFNLSADFDSVDTLGFGGEQSGGINFASLEFSRGVNNLFGAMGGNSDASLLPSGVQPSRRSGFSDRFAEGKFSKIFASYTRLQAIRKHHLLVLNMEYQWSKDLLLPLEQYSVGGPSNVRAFPNAQILWDRAYFASLEWLIGAPFIADKPAFSNRIWGEILQFSVFYDIATGKLNEPLESEDQGYGLLNGIGLGLRFILPGLIESSISLATEVGGDDVGNDRDPQFWGDVTYHF